MIYIIICLILVIISLIGYIKLKKPLIIYKYPDKIEKFNNDVLDLIFKYQQDYAWKAENIYREIEFHNKTNYNIDANSYQNLLKEYSKFEGRAMMCKEIIEEINKIESICK